MLIAFLGDVHGRVFHAVAAFAELQERLGRQLDFLVQVGDMGAFPDPARMDEFTKRYLEVDPSEADFARLLQAGGERVAQVGRMRDRLGGAIHFVRGNHEDFDWLDGLPIDGQTAQADSFDALRYVPDATVLDVGGVRIAWLGGVEELPGQPAIDREAYGALMELGPGAIDVLVTHQGPYGTTVGHYGNVQGSKLMTELVDRLQPRYHVAGHAHELCGPKAFGPTTYLGMASIVASARWQPDARGLQPGCLAVLDTETGELRPITDDWLAGFDAPFDFDAWVRRFEEAGG